ncbi:MAG: elongation factor P, partial [Betaproteobacteria bacterium]|nr:elongation factor P [Betaproteobacteria bacterium]
MIINALQIREGMILRIENELYRVTWTMHRTPGKGNAVMQTKLKHLTTGKNMEQRFMSAERVEKADLETREYQFLYKDGDDYIFMDNTTFEQQPLPNELIGESAKYLIEGETYLCTFYQEEAVGIDLPKTMVLKVIYAPPEIKKATATSTMRPIELERNIV